MNKALFDDGDMMASCEDRLRFWCASLHREQLSFAHRLSSVRKPTFDRPTSSRQAARRMGASINPASVAACADDGVVISRRKDSSGAEKNSR
jgi:hypothetical protein